MKTAKLSLEHEELEKKTQKFTGKLRKIHAVYQEIANSVENIALLIRREIVTGVYKNCQLCVVSVKLFCLV